MIIPLMTTTLGVPITKQSFCWVFNIFNHVLIIAEHRARLDILLNIFEWYQPASLGHFVVELTTQNLYRWIHRFVIMMFFQWRISSGAFLSRYSFKRFDIGLQKNFVNKNLQMSQPTLPAAVVVFTWNSRQPHPQSSTTEHRSTWSRNALDYTFD